MTNTCQFKASEVNLHYLFRSVLNSEPVAVGLAHVAQHVIGGPVRGHEDDLDAGGVGNLLKVVIS